MFAVNWYYPTVFLTSLIILTPLMLAGLRVFERVTELWNSRNRAQFGRIDPRLLRFREKDWE